ncbi:hypothetical protein CHARACLAT_029707, partial [Characodon lateralis]|nr:hypothetical protein [Characodon lateralis]
WWSYFWKQRSRFWMDLFNDLRERHLFNGSRQHMSLVRYCFLGVLQKELDEYKQLWNTHTICPVRQSKCPSSKPEAMYHLPHRFKGRNCGFLASAQALSHFNTLMPIAELQLMMNRKIGLKNCSDKVVYHHLFNGKLL